MKTNSFNYGLKIKLLKIFRANRERPSWKNINLINILTEPRLLFYVYTKLKTITKGWTVNRITLKIINNLSNQIKSNNYPWNNIFIKKWDLTNKRLYKKVFYFKNLIVWKALKIILNIIYKPIFSRKNKLLTKSKYMEYLKLEQIWLENYNIKYAFQNKFHQIFKTMKIKIIIKVLKKKVHDLKILKLIKILLEQDLVLNYVIINPFNHLRKDSLNVILSEIYLHEFDLYVKKYIKKLNYINWKWNLKHLWKTYLYWAFTINKKKFQKLNFGDFQKLKFTLKKWNRLKMQIQVKKQKNIQITFYRYKTNWFLFTNFNNKIVKLLTDKIIKWSNKNLNLILIKKQQFTINLKKNKATCAGFALFSRKKKTKKVEYKNDIKIQKKSWQFLFLSIDHKYIKQNLIKSQIINSKFKPIYNFKYINLKPWDMRLKFLQDLTKLIKFYCKTINYLNNLRFYYYVYKFSYLKTLKCRINKSTISLSLIKRSNIYFPSYFKIIKNF